MLTFEEWLDLYGDELRIEASELGDIIDPERFEERAYERYCYDCERRQSRAAPARASGR